MKKLGAYLLTAALLALLLGACGQPVMEAAQEPGAPAPAAASAPEATPEITPEPPVDLGGTAVEADAETLELREGAYDWDSLLAAAERLTRVKAIDFGETALSAGQMTALREAFPGAEIRCRLSLFGQELPLDTEALALPDMDPAQTDELAAALPLLPELKTLSFLREDGSCAYGLEDIPQLDKLREAAPEAAFDVCFELFGQTVSSADERIEYLCVPIGNEGADTVRAVLPYLRSCSYLLMDGCGVDNEVMAQLREDFPETKIVWRVWLVRPDYDSPRLLRTGSFLTDTHRIRTIVVDDSTCGVLKYCVETKYVDFGHNDYISDFSFLAYMPELEAAIIGLTHCHDLTPLENCPKLEYLECYGSDVTDLSPLQYCTNLKHLNCSRLKINDITPIYGLDLERLRCVVTDVPKEQLEEYAALHPDCQMLLAGWAPHENGWRYDENGDMVPRYRLLREQMEYDLDREYGIL